MNISYAENNFDFGLNKHGMYVIKVKWYIHCS